MWRKILHANSSYLLLAPSFVLVGAFLCYPALSGIYHAFTRWQAVDASSWVGFDNFAAMVSDPFIRHGVANQLVLSFADFTKALVPPFLVAEMIHALAHERERYWMRTFFVIPMVALGAIIGMGFPWVGALAFLIFMAGLNNIPAEIIDAARIDGTSTLRQIRHIDIPMLVPQFRLVIILTLIGSIQDFGRILVMTGGGPGYATYVPALWMYEQTFMLSHFGYACAIGLSLFVVILTGSTLVLRLMKSDVDQ